MFAQEPKAWVAHSVVADNSAGICSYGRWACSGWLGLGCAGHACLCTSLITNTFPGPPPSNTPYAARADQAALSGRRRRRQCLCACGGAERLQPRQQVGDARGLARTARYGESLYVCDYIPQQGAVLLSLALLRPYGCPSGLACIIGGVAGCSNTSHTTALVGLDTTGARIPALSSHLASHMPHHQCLAACTTLTNTDHL